MSEEIRFVEGQFQKITVGPNDVIVMQYPGVLSGKALAGIYSDVGRHFPNHKILILEEGVTIGAISPQATEKSPEPSDRMITISKNESTAARGGLFG